MILAVTGGREGKPSPASLTRLEKILLDAREGEIRHGAAPGVDRAVAAWFMGDFIRAHWSSPVNLRISITPYPAEWSLLGRRAGPARNLRMLTEPTRAHLLLAWPGGAGTADCVRQAQGLGIRVRFMEEEEPEAEP